MKVGDKIVFMKTGWATLDYGTIFTILSINYLPKKGSNSFCKCFEIYDGEHRTNVKSKHFKSLRKLRKQKLKKIKNYVLL